MTSPRSFIEPPAWDDAALDAARRRATAEFIAERTAELMAGNVRYREVFLENLTAVRVLLAATDDLIDLASGAALAANPRLMRAARYLGGPPISADDLDTLVQVSVATRKRLNLDLAQSVVLVIEHALDADRFPWLFESPRRTPTEEEREIALRWTAGLMTAQQVQTGRRGEASKRQEDAIRQLLLSLGFAQQAARRVNAIEDLGPGTFCAEVRVVAPKCDIPIRLRDGRLLLIECKVSNSEVNSIKRLIHECGNKARIWTNAFGSEAIPAAVLAGVFKLTNLREAQESRGIAIFWEHDLTPLATFLQNAT
jgi:hypothetical protein